MDDVVGTVMVILVMTLPVLLCLVGGVTIIRYTRRHFGATAPMLPPARIHRGQRDAQRPVRDNVFQPSLVFGWFLGVLVIALGVLVVATVMFGAATKHW